MLPGQNTFPWNGCCVCSSGNTTCREFKSELILRGCPATVLVGDNITGIIVGKLNQGRIGFYFITNRWLICYRVWRGSECDRGAVCEWKTERIKRGVRRNQWVNSDS